MVRLRNDDGGDDDDDDVIGDDKLGDDDDDVIGDDKLSDDDDDVIGDDKLSNDDDDGDDKIMMMMSSKWNMMFMLEENDGAEKNRSKIENVCWWS